MKEKLIEVKNASFCYKTENNEVKAVENVSLDINKGEFVVLLGHNGSGKSTLAKLLNGFLTPQEGEVLVDGVSTADEDKIFEIRSKVGMVFQNPDNQMVASIIEDDIAFGCENLGVPREDIIKRVDWALATVGMSEYRDRTPFKLSGGQKQRIAIAAILAMLPQVLILDESTAMLDPEGREEVMRTITALNKQKQMTVVLITHYMDEALNADKVVVLNGGKAVCVGTPREVFAQEEIIREAKLELPTATQIAYDIRRALNVEIKEPLTDEELAEALCRLA